MRIRAYFTLLTVSFALGCGGSDSVGGAGAGGTAGTPGTGGTGGSVFSANPPLVLDEGERPASVAIPSDYDPTKSHPLVILLHGRGAFGELQANFWGMFDVIDDKQFVFVYPDAIQNTGLGIEWNSAPGCCDADEVDDFGYISGLIEEAQQIYNVDADRVYLIGHSSGGFMSFAMACERSELITAIVSLAGLTFEGSENCQPSTLPVSVLAAHDPEDQTVLYEGFSGFSLGAVETVERFAERAGCDLDSSTALDRIDLTGDGALETDRLSYSVGCAEGIDMERWTIVNEDCGPACGNAHIPIFSDAWADMTVDWLFSHSR